MDFIKLGFSSFISGLLFGAGLTISNMINPNKVLAFLDITGNWDPSLLIVLLFAVIVTFLGYRYVLRFTSPKYDKTFYLPSKKHVDKQLVIGAALFGAGWGLAGYCPGPAFSALGLGVMDPVYFIIGMLLGWILWYFWNYLFKKLGKK